MLMINGNESDYLLLLFAQIDRAIEKVNASYTALIMYLYGSTKSFSIAGDKTYQHFVLDSEGNLYDFFKDNLMQDVYLEIPDDSILLDGILAIGGINWRTLK